MLPGYIAFTTEVHQYKELSPEMKRLIRQTDFKSQPGWAAMATPEWLKNKGAKK